MKPHIPTIHRNGTSKDALLTAVCDAGYSVQLAMEKMAETAPNGRDYYMNPGALKTAIDVHKSRMDALKAVFTALQDDAMEISEQDD